MESMPTIRGVFKQFVARTWRRRDTRVIQCIMYGNTTSQYKNIHQENVFRFICYSCTPSLKASLPANPEKLKLQNISTMLSRVKVGDPSFIYKKMIKTSICKSLWSVLKRLKMSWGVSFPAFHTVSVHHPTIFSHHILKKKHRGRFFRGNYVWRVSVISGFSYSFLYWLVVFSYCTLNDSCISSPSWSGHKLFEHPLYIQCMHVVMHNTTNNGPWNMILQIWLYLVSHPVLHRIDVNYTYNVCML